MRLKKRFSEAYYIDGRTAYARGSWKTDPNLLLSVTRMCKASRRAWWSGFRDRRLESKNA